MEAKHVVTYIAKNLGWDPPMVYIRGTGSDCEFLNGEKSLWRAWVPIKQPWMIITYTRVPHEYLRPNGTVNNGNYTSDWENREVFDLREPDSIIKLREWITKINREA